VLAATAVVLTAAWNAGGLPPSPTTCYAVVTIATVCSLGTCQSTYYVDDYWCSRTPASDISPIDRNPADRNINRVVDDHHDVLATNDWCAWVFNTNDRLGTNFGGTNTIRPDHNGVDIQADRGDGVGAVAHGQITYVGWQNPSNHSQGCGYMMNVAHPNGDVSTCCHLVPNSETQVFGDWVRSGTVIAQANSSGNSTADHLHLIYKVGGTTAVEYWTRTGTQPTASELNGNC
jgi:hypothetical protein